MPQRWLWLPFIALVFVTVGGLSPTPAEAISCIWKVAGPGGGVLYLGGSIHALRPTDYPLPPAYNRAFDASSRIVFEDDPKDASTAFKAVMKAGQYPRGDSIKNHIDPRTYDYLRRFFALHNVPEEKFARFRPWLLDVMISAPPPEYFQLGVERFLTKRAQANSKPISGLESAREHYSVFTGLSDREGEAVLLITFINASRDTRSGVDMVAAWRRGDVETLARETRQAFGEFPAFGQRLLGARNRTWIPKLDEYLRSRKTYFVVVGAAHLGGADGLLALLRARGCQLEQL